MKQKVYIDADSLLYRASYITNNKTEELDEARAIAEEEEGDELDLPDATDETQEAMQRVFMSMVNEIMAVMGTEVDPIPVIVITVKNSSNRCHGMDENFRYAIMDSVADENVKGYKHNRSGMETPIGLEDIYNWVFDLPNTMCEEGVEADDVVTYYGLQGHIVAALDKDVIYSLPLAYNYGKKEWIETSERERQLWFYTQMVIGDTGDGLRGVYRVGAKWAEKNLADKMTDYDLWATVATKYVEKGQTLEEAIATARCVSMTQWTPEAGLVLWTPPKKGE